jgi:bla regulator protein BlaR1
MITYIVKTLLCAAILFMIYFLFLEREKMYRFNRFYLLFSIVFSFGVSFITIKTASPVVTVNELITPANLPSVLTKVGGFDRLSNQEQATTKSDFKQNATVVPIEKKSQLPYVLLGLYLAGTAFFLIRFVINLSRLLLKVKDNKSVAFHGAKLILSNDIPIPYSFLKYIFIDREKFEQGTIEKEILQHELTHVNQKHTLDVLMVELITVFAWINPLLFLFRRAIMLNHEYLADEAVVNTFNDTENYRQLLFSKVCQSNNLVLSSSFNYLTTKKRFTMMTRKTSQKVAILKQIALIPMIAVIGFIFSTRVIAQDKPKQSTAQTQPQFSKTDAPQSIIDEYHALLTKYNITLEKVTEQSFNTPPFKVKSTSNLNVNSADTVKKISKTDKDRMAQLFFQMSYKQQSHEFFTFSPRAEIKTKMIPTKEQFESWKNPKMYGIWFSGAKRQKNSILNNYSNTDFYYYELRKLDEKSAKIMKYQTEVGLTKKEEFEKYNAGIAARLKANPDYKYDIMVIVYSPKHLKDIDAGK